MFLHVSLLLLAVLHVDGSPHEDTQDTQWEEWKIKYKKKYNDDEGYRRNIWEKNMCMILAHYQEAEQGKHSYKLGINNLADMTSEEVAENLTCLNHHRAKFSRKSYLQSGGNTGCDWSTNTMTQSHHKNCQPHGELPKSIDYRQTGLVTSVKIQGLCGCCWAFSAAGALEGQLAKKTGRLLDLSTQNLLDCVDNKACAGGHMIDAFEYVQKNRGMNSEKDYPYVKEKQPCRFNSSAVAAHCTGFKQIPEGDEYELAKALYEVGPLSVGIDFRNASMYTNGVYYNPQCDKDNPGHAVLLVGYGETAEGDEYWIIKNSWGEEWGEEGYMRIARNRDNHCGIATDASYPLM